MKKKLTIPEIRALWNDAYPKPDMFMGWLHIIMPWMVVMQITATLQIWWNHRQIIGTLLDGQRSE